MNVGDLQRFVGSLGTLFASRQGSPQADMVALGEALEPFKDLPLPTFTAFLRQAKEYKETGKVTTSGPAKKASGGGAGRTPKAPVKTKADAAAIQQAVDKLEILYSGAADPDLTYVTIEMTVKQIHDEFDAGGLKEVAKGFGLTSGVTSKKACLEKIEHKIKERKARNERGTVIANAAKAEPMSIGVHEAEEVVEATVVGQQPGR
jgi:hypothetical protein